MKHQLFQTEEMINEHSFEWKNDKGLFTFYREQWEEGNQRKLNKYNTKLFDKKNNEILRNSSACDQMIKRQTIFR